jgi:4-carboxymuconolactone decarboxylase
MDERTRALVRLAASLTTEDGAQVQAMDRAAAVDAPAAEEVLLQSYLFLGYPVALNALGLWRRRTGRPALPSLDQGEEAEGPALWRRRGAEVCRAVYGDHYERLRELMGQIHPELDRWAVVEGYGKVLGRPGLELRVRELCVAALLSGTTATRQLHSHLRGCLNVGAAPDEVEAMLDAVRDITGSERDRETRRVWQRVLTRWLGKGRD